MSNLLDDLDVQRILQATQSIAPFRPCERCLLAVSMLQELCTGCQIVRDITRLHERADASTRLQNQVAADINFEELKTRFIRTEGTNGLPAALYELVQTVLFSILTPHAARAFLGEGSTSAEELATVAAGLHSVVQAVMSNRFVDPRANETTFVAHMPSGRVVRLQEVEVEMHKLEQRALRAERDLAAKSEKEPPWVKEAAEALGQPQAKLNWTQVLQEVRANGSLHTDFNIHKQQLKGQVERLQMRTQHLEQEVERLAREVEKGANET